MLLFSWNAWSQSSLKLAQPDWRTGFQNGWGVRVEATGDTSYGKNGKINGYDLRADLRIRKMWSKEWGSVFGVSAIQENHDGQDPIDQLDLVYVGIYNVSRVFDLRWKSQLLFSYIPDSETRQEELRNGVLRADIRTTIPLGAFGSAQLRYKYYEYLVQRLEEGVDMRASKLEFWPAVEARRWRFGVQSKMSHKFKYDRYASTLEMAPFVGYEGGHIDPSIRVAYMPFVTGDGRDLADGWDKRPVYSFELEMVY